MKQYRNKKYKVRCCVAFCSNASASEASGKHEEISYHPFPREVQLRTAWLRALGKEHAYYLPETSVVCSQHFLSEDIYETETGVKQIANGAIPSTVQICTMCLDIDSKLLLMSKHKLEQAYEKLTGYPLCDQGNLKHTVCVQCSQILKKIDGFREKSLRARSLLMDLVKKYEFITVKHLEMTNCTKSQLTGNVVAKVLEPGRCDIVELPDEDKEMECDETVDLTETLEVTNGYCDDTLLVDSELELLNQSDIWPTTEENLSDSSEKQSDGLLKDSNKNPYDSCFAKEDGKIELFKYENDNFACLQCFEEFTDELDYTYHMRMHTQSEGNITTQVCESQTAVSSSWDNTPSSGAWNKPRVQELDDVSPPPADSAPPSDNSFSVRLATTDVNKVYPSDGAVAIQKNNFVLTSKTGELVDQFSDNNRRISTNIERLPNCVVKLYDIFANSKYAALRSPQKTQKAIRNLNCQTTNQYKFHETENIISITNVLEVAESEFSENFGDIQSIAPLYNLRTSTEKICFICDVCRITFKRKGLLVKHVKTHTKVNLFSCKFCKLEFNCENNYAIHMQIHRHIKRFSCNLCDYNCAQSGTLVRHMRIHTGEKPFSCNLCDYKSAYGSNLTNHMKKHTGEKYFSCKWCHYKSASGHGLEGHMRTHTGEKPFSCKLCKYASAYSSALKKHMRTHTGEKPFSCLLCDYKSANSHNLETHMRTHTGEKPFSCKFCDFKCARNGNLSSHMKTHTREKPFSCLLCDYKSAYNCDLASHMRTHTGEKPFSCLSCDYKSAYSSNLANHMKTHTGVKPFSCNLCVYASVKRSGLVRHMRTHTVK
ncbi:zinc finger protein 28-like isoform X1 [Pararge aegeria]|uniref:zinc finger protein 28-like isoform X1 n=1 Tax=Pararge aegeria TaxID=116150 RepID=UPI0019D2F817|nr:zinc finger protein 28-like isoform X1 [Pararge aegeria]